MVVHTVGAQCSIERVLAAFRNYLVVSANILCAYFITLPKENLVYPVFGRFSLLGVTRRLYFFFQKMSLSSVGSY